MLPKLLTQILHNDVLYLVQNVQVVMTKVSKLHRYNCSRGMAGTLTPELLDAKLDVNGSSFKDAANKAGYGGSSHKALLYPCQKEGC